MVDSKRVDQMSQMCRFMSGKFKVVEGHLKHTTLKRVDYVVNACPLPNSHPKMHINISDPDMNIKYLLVPL